MRRWGGPVLLATAGGLALGLWALGRAGLTDVLAVVGRVGWGGFALFVASTVPAAAALGMAWAAGMRAGVPRPPWRFAWARAVRDAANELLPFSQIGGLVAGLRVLLATDLPPARIYAATIVDLTTEMAAQVVMTLAGLWVAASFVAGSGRMEAAISAGVAILIAMTVATALLQRHALRLVAGLAGRVLPAAGEAIEAVREELIVFGRRRGATIPPFLWNLAAWAATIVSSWVALRLLGAGLPIGHVLALECFIFALRSGAFFVPAAIGVQEVGYLLVAGFFGLSQDVALALSLVKRARDLAVGLPMLLLWQWSEWRSARAPLTDARAK